MLRQPYSFASRSATSTLERGMLVHVRCMHVSRPKYACTVLTSDAVRSDVRPPAFHVMSTNSGPSLPIRSIRSYKLLRPCGVRGGKYSKLHHTRPSALAFSSFAVILLLSAMVEGACGAEQAFQRPRVGYRPRTTPRWRSARRSCKCCSRGASCGAPRRSGCTRPSRAQWIRRRVSSRISRPRTRTSHGSASKFARATTPRPARRFCCW